MWRNFGALMGARLQGYSTRACNYTQDTRPSCASCRVQFLHMLVYVHVCASTCKHGRSRAVFCTIYSSRNRFLGVFARSRGAAFSTGTIVNPSIDSSFFPSPPLVVRPNDFSSYLFSQNDGKRAFENFLANRLVNLGLDLSIKFSFY